MRADGFTLIEVVVALAVLAIALSAAIQAATVTTGSAAGLRERTFAHWVADNELTEMQADGAWETGRRTRSRTMAGREWPLTITVEETQFPSVRRVRIAVGAPAGEGDSVHTLQGLLRDPELTP
ncbi:type II secretion system minor pseudopilin GspI [Arhodomonas sp. SL1]|uniref:type II secretion system minor pseudopilin GspI n=1 Tax=Arhodomonas sp. SL1 TaxID=3425691 RepID=UPI003F882BDF